MARAELVVKKPELLSTNAAPWSKVFRTSLELRRSMFDTQFMRGLTATAMHADLALIVIDAHKGMTDDIYRQYHALKILGVNRAIFIVSKMDLVDYSQNILDDIDEKLRARAELLGLTVEGGIPVSEENNDGMDWYAGPTLASQLEPTRNAGAAPAGPFRFMIEQIDGNAVTGLIVGGTISEREGIVALPSASAGKVWTRTVKVESYLLT